jgi:hypothetical protein
MEDKHSISIPDTVLTKALGLLQEANALLLPYVTPLTPAERHTLAKMGEKTLSFVEKAHEFASQSPDLIPPFLDMAEFNDDVAIAHNLRPLFLITQQLHENVDDTTMLAGSDAYQDALMFYNSVKIAARQNVLGAKAAYEELRKRFPGHKRKSANEADAQP